MNLERMKAARREAMELCDRIDEAIANAKDDQQKAKKSNHRAWFENLGFHLSNIDTAAVRRQSMELTRALARMRKP